MYLDETENDINKALLLKVSINEVKFHWKRQVICKNSKTGMLGIVMLLTFSLKVLIVIEIFLKIFEIYVCD